MNCEASLEYDYGRKVAFQKNNHAMVLYSPSSCESKISQAKLTIFFSNYKDHVSEIRDAAGNIIDLEVLENDGRIQMPFGSMFVKTDSVYFHIMPCVNTKDQKDAFMELICLNSQLCLHIYNYCGKEKEYRKKELRTLTNGFVFDAEEAENMSFGEFLDLYRGVKLFDKILCNVHNRYTLMREVSYITHSAKLSCCISPVSTGIKYINTNDC